MRILNAIIIGFSLIIGLWGLGWNIGNRFQVAVWDGMSCVIDSSTGTVYHIAGVFFVERDRLVDESWEGHDHHNAEDEMHRDEDHKSEFNEESDGN